MTEKSNLTPKRRFAKFQSDQAWTLVNLGEMASFSKGNGYSKNDLTSIGKPIILYGRLYKKYETVIEYVDTFTFEKENSVISTGNEVIIPASGESSEDISRASVVSKPGIILGGDLNIVRPNHEIDSVFLALSISNGKQQKELSKRAQGKSVVHLHNSDLKEVNLFLPEKVEQIEIGDFFKKLDSSIVLQQRKLEKIKALKDAYLLEMFPTEGQLVPKRRFSGFTQSWKKQKLGEITESFSGGTPSVNNRDYYNGSIPFIRSGEINSSTTELFINDNALNNSSAKLVVEGDILYALYGATSGEVGISQINGAINQAILAIKPKFGDDSYLITQWLKKQKQAILSTYLQGGQGNLSGSIVKNLIIDLPTNKEEQAKIGSLFKQLDKIIAHHQCKLEKLQNLRKAYLHEMFV